jgi:hypothetical protein
MLTVNCEWYVPADKKKFIRLFKGLFSQEFYESVSINILETTVLNF